MKFSWTDRKGAIETAIAEIKKGEDFRMIIECVTGVRHEGSDFCDYPELMPAKEYIDFMREVAHTIHKDIPRLIIDMNI